MAIDPNRVNVEQLGFAFDRDLYRRARWNRTLLNFYGSHSSSHNLGGICHDFDKP